MANLLIRHVESNLHRFRNPLPSHTLRELVLGIDVLSTAIWINAYIDRAALTARSEQALRHSAMPAPAYLLARPEGKLLTEVLAHLH